MLAAAATLAEVAGIITTLAKDHLASLLVHPGHATVGVYYLAKRHEVRCSPEQSLWYNTASQQQAPFSVPLLSRCLCTLDTQQWAYTTWLKDMRCAAAVAPAEAIKQYRHVPARLYRERCQPASFTQAAGFRWPVMLGACLGSGSP